MYLLIYGYPHVLLMHRYEHFDQKINILQQYIHIMFTSETVIAINQWIDKYHGPAQWAPFVAIGLLVSLEGFLPTKTEWESVWDKWLTWLKSFFITLTMFVGASQGFTGGCVIQIPQNWLSQTALGRDWHPYGLVFREYVPQQWWWALHAFYILCACLGIYLWRKWLNKRWFSVKNYS